MKYKLILETPKPIEHCGGCPFSDKYMTDLFCEVTGWQKERLVDKPEWCPLIEVGEGEE